MTSCSPTALLRSMSHHRARSVGGPGWDARIDDHARCPLLHREVRGEILVSGPSALRPQVPGSEPGWTPGIGEKTNFAFQPPRQNAAHELSHSRIAMPVKVFPTLRRVARGGATSGLAKHVIRGEVGTGARQLSCPPPRR